MPPQEGQGLTDFIRHHLHIGAHAASSPSLVDSAGVVARA
jgi:hypothetical protein